MQSREERLEEKLCEKMSLFCSFSPFVMGKLFLRKVKFYLRNVTLRRVLSFPRGQPTKPLTSRSPVAPDIQAKIWRRRSMLSKSSMLHTIPMARWPMTRHASSLAASLEEAPAMPYRPHSLSKVSYAVLNRRRYASATCKPHRMPLSKQHNALEVRRK